MPLKKGTQFDKWRTKRGFLEKPRQEELRQAPPRKEFQDTLLKKVGRAVLPRRAELKLGLAEATPKEQMRERFVRAGDAQIDIIKKERREAEKKEKIRREERRKELDIGWERASKMTGIKALDLATETADFLGGLAVRKVSRSLVTGVPFLNFVLSKEKKEEWVDFMNREWEKGSVHKFKKVVDKLEEAEVMQPSPEWQNASLEEKFGKEHLLETTLHTGTSVAASLGFFAFGPTAGVVISAAPVGADIREQAIAHGRTSKQADMLAIPTMVTVGLIDRIVPARIFGGFLKIKNKFSGSFARRLFETALLEAGTEVTQETVQMIAEATFREIGFDEAMTRYAMSAYGGVLMGGGMQTIATFVDNARKDNIKMGLTIEDVSKAPDKKTETQFEKWKKERLETTKTPPPEDKGTENQLRGETASSVISYINKDDKKVYTKLSKSELEVLRDEDKNIPEATKGLRQIHLDAITDQQKEAGAEISREEFIKGHPQAQQIFDNIIQKEDTPNKFDIKKDGRFANLKDKYNRVADKLDKIEKSIKEEKGTLEKGLKLKEEKTKLTETRKKLAGLRKEGKNLSTDKKEIMRRLMLARVRLTEIRKSVRRAKRFGKTFTDSAEKARTRQVREIIEVSKIAGQRIDKLVEKALAETQDYTKMTDSQFSDFVMKLTNISQVAVEKEFLREQIWKIVAQKELSKIENLTSILFKGKNISQLSKKNLEKLKGILTNFQKLDVVLPVTFVKNIRKFQKEGKEGKEGRMLNPEMLTYRELAKEVGVENLSDIVNKKGQRILGGYSLRKLSPFHRKMVDMVMTAQLNAGKMAELKIEKLTEIVKKARGSRKMSVKGAFAKWDNKIAEYIQTAETERGSLEKEMTKEEIEAGKFIIDLNLNYNTKIKEIYGIKSRFEGVYMPHSMKTFLQTILYKKEGVSFVGSISEAFKNIWAGIESDKEMVGAIPDTATMLAYDKFFGNLLYRTGELDPNLDLVDVIGRYISAMENKLEIDKYRPYLIGIAKISDIAEANNTDKTRAIEPYVKEFLNNAVGRKTTSTVIRQGSEVDKAQDVLISWVTFKYLWFSIPYNIVNIGAMMVATSTLLYTPKAFKNLFLNTIRFNLIRNKQIWNKIDFAVEESPLRKAFKKDSITVQKTLHMAGHIGIGFARTLTSRLGFMIELTPKELESADKLPTEKFKEIIIKVGAFDLTKLRTTSIEGASPTWKLSRQFLTWALPFFTSGMHTMARLTTQSFNAIKTADLKKFDREDVIYLRRVLSGAVFTYVLLTLVAEAFTIDEDDDPYGIKAKTIRNLKRDIDFFRQSFEKFIPVRYDEKSGEFKFDPSRAIPVGVSYIATLVEETSNVFTGKTYDGTDISKGMYGLYNAILPTAILQFTGRKGFWTIRENMLDDYLKGKINAREYSKYLHNAKTENRNRRWEKEDPLWDELVFSKQENIIKNVRRIKILNNKFKMRGMDFLGDLSLNTTNEEKATALSKPEYRDIIRFIRNNPEKFCRKGKTKKFIDCLISDNLYDEIKKQRRPKRPGGPERPERPTK